MGNKKEIQRIARHAGADAERLATLLGTTAKVPRPGPKRSASGKVIQFPSR